MTKDRILSEVKLHIETARDIDVNRHISTALTQLSEVGIERVKTVTVSEGADGLDPTTRTSATADNYYPDLRCLVLPEDLIYIARVKYGDYELIKSSMYDYNTGNMASYSYVMTDTNEMYLSFDLEDNDTIEIWGMWAIRNLELLSDKYENWMLSHVLSRLFATKPHKDADMFSIYEAERQKSWRKIRNSINSVGSYTAKDGVLG